MASSSSEDNEKAAHESASPQVSMDSSASMEVTETIEHGNRALTDRNFSLAAELFRKALHAHIGDYGESDSKSAPLYCKYATAKLLRDFKEYDEKDILGKECISDLEDAGHELSLAWDLMKNTPNNLMEKMNILSGWGMQHCAKAIAVYKAQLNQLVAETQEPSEAEEALAAPTAIQKSCDELDHSIPPVNAKMYYLQAKLDDLKIKLNDFEKIIARPAFLGIQEGTSGEVVPSSSSGSLGGTSLRTSSQMPEPNADSTKASADDTDPTGGDAGKKRSQPTDTDTEVGSSKKNK